MGFLAAAHTHAAVAVAVVVHTAHTAADYTAAAVDIVEQLAVAAARHWMGMDAHSARSDSR